MGGRAGPPLFMNTKQKVIAVALASIVVVASLAAIFRNDIKVEFDAMRDGDIDGDGMETKWEKAHGLDPLRNDRRDDNDRDGFVNIAEHSWDLPPDDWDADDDKLPDGSDPEPTVAARVIPQRLMWEPGLGEATIETDVSRLVSSTKVWPLFGDEPADFTPGGSYDSPHPDEEIAEDLHRFDSGFPWGYVETRRALGEQDVIARSTPYDHYVVNVGNFKIQHALKRVNFESTLTNKIPLEINDSNDNPFRYYLGSYNATTDLPRVLDIRGSSSVDAALEIRLYPDGRLDPLNKLAWMEPTNDVGHGAFRVEFAIPQGTRAGTLVIIPLELDGDVVAAPAADAIELLHVSERTEQATVVETTLETSPLIDRNPVVTTRALVDPASGVLEWLDGTAELAQTGQRIATTISLIADLDPRSFNIRAHVGSLDEELVGDVRTVIVAEEEDRHVVTTRAVGLVKIDQRFAFVTRTTQESFKELPAKYAPYKEGMVKKATSTAAAAAQVASNGAIVAKPIFAHGEGVKAAYAALEDTARLSYEKAKEKTTGQLTRGLKLAGGALGIAAAARSVVALDHALSASADDAVKAWSAFAVTGLHAAAFLLPASPMAAAAGFALTVVIEKALDGSLERAILETSVYVTEVLHGSIPSEHHAKAFNKAADELRERAFEARAPLYVGQDTDGDGEPEGAPIGIDGGIAFMPKGSALPSLALLLAVVLGAALYARKRRA